MPATLGTDSLGILGLGLDPDEIEVEDDSVDGVGAFNREFGVKQGRIAAAGTGEYLFLLGYSDPGYVDRLRVGDYAQISQTADFADNSATMMRVHARLRPPTEMPDGLAWKFSLLIDGDEHASQILTPGSTRTRVDLAASVVKLAAGNHELVLRLEVIEL